MEMKRLNMILGLLAAVILIGSCAVYAYNLMPKGDTSVVEVNGVEYSWEDVFSDFEMRTFTALDDEYEGVPLADMIADAGVDEPGAHTYRLTGLDGYQKDVCGSDLVNGYLIEEGHRAVLPGMTKSYWVSDLATIEVI